MQATPLALALVACLTVPALAHDLPTITATLNLSQTGSENPSVDLFFEQLDASDGQVVRLELTLVPDQSADGPGYSLRSVGGMEDPVTCGSGTFGTVDNLDKLFTLDFQHPGHFHAPTTVHIGDRLRFPHHDITCAATDVGADYTLLHLTGDFIVETAEIPTATAYTLFPVNP